MKILLFLLPILTLYASQSLVTTNTATVLNVPTVNGASVAPYNNLGPTRLEVRLTNVVPCVNGDTWGSFFRIEGQNLTDNASNMIFGFGCNANGSRSYAVHFGSGPRTLGTIDYTEMILRIQREGAGSGRYSVEVWKPDGTGYLKWTFNHPQAANPVKVVARERFFIRGFGTTEIAWMRWYSGIISEGSPMPKDTGAMPGDLGDWEFEGNLNDSSNGGLVATRSGTCPSSCYVPSPVYPPVLQVQAQNALAGSAMTLNANDSFTYDGQPIDFQWQQISGPGRVLMDNPLQAMTSARGTITGTYVFRLLATTGGETLTKDIEVKVRNIDANGFTVFPSNILLGMLTLSFQLADIPGAVDVRVTVKKPDGRSLPSVICTQSPCEIKVDDRQKNHMVRLEFRDESGQVLSETDWQETAVPQTARLATSLTSSFMRSNINLYPLSSVGAAEQQISQFLADKALDFNGGSTLLRKWNPDAYQPVYSDHAGAYAPEWYRVHQTAATHGYTNIEDMFIHLSKDYVNPNGFSWTGMDQFDASEKNSAGAAVNGVILRNGNNNVDVTVAAYNSTAGDVPITDTVLIGFVYPFDEVNFVISSPGRGCPVAWEYWNGTQWTSLPLRSDETVTGGQLLGQSGKVLFTPPSDWAKSVQVGSNQKWWIRIVVSGGTTPVASRIFGDSWVAGTTLRGWDPNAGGRVNVGLGPLEYNPTPPAGSSARFRHQARIIGSWGVNNACFNVSNVQNGERTVARFIVDRVEDKLAKGWNGLWVDNGAPSAPLPAPEWQDYTEMAGKSKLREGAESYKAILAYLRTKYPDYKTCVNAGIWSLVREGSCYLDEALKYTVGDAQPYGAFQLWPDDDWRSAGPERIKPSNNPNGIVGWITVTDNADSEFFTNSGWVIWDKANRGPMTSMASYLMYANENTRFLYHTGANFWYNHLDEFDYIDTVPDWTTTTDVVADSGSGTKVVSGYFANFPATSGGVMVRMGATGEYIRWRKVNDGQLSTTEPVSATYPAGTMMFTVKTGRLSSDDPPPLERLRSWGQYFPAMNIDIGIPDPAGLNGGAPVVRWKSAAESNTLNGVQRRDFTKSIVLFANGANSHTSNGTLWYRLMTPGTEYVFANEGMPETLYPLLSDGTTGPGIKSIRLRTAEGFVLMKEPVY